jgi:hypothetical protein
VGLLVVASGLHLSPGDLDPLDNINEHEFEQIFHVSPAADPQEEKLREKVLEENEAIVKDNNADFESGRKTWFDAINEFANLPPEEFETQKTGAIDPTSTGRKGYARGLLPPLPEDAYDEESERHFDQFRYSRASVPTSYSSVDLGMSDINQEAL